MVKLEEVDLSQGVHLRLSGIDLVDGTPVVDIKPYLPWVESLPEAQAGWAPEPPKLLPVIFTPQALQQLADLPQSHSLQQLIQEVLSQDPRPAYQRATAARIYGVRLAGFNVKFIYHQADQQEVIEVLALEAG